MIIPEKSSFSRVPEQEHIEMNKWYVTLNDMQSTDDTI